MNAEPRILPCGDRALTVEFADIVDAAVNARVLALDAALRQVNPPGIVEAVPTYRSLLVEYDCAAIGFAALRSQLLELCAATSVIADAGATWTVPVAYGGEFGFDLESLSAARGLSPSDIIERHSAVIYRVFMIGFLPGFTYLGGLDPVLATPRRDYPRPKVPAGSIKIGGVQSAIASIEGPSGWHVIGRTPVRAFMPSRDPVVFIKPGDKVALQPVSEREFSRLDAAAERGELIAEQLP